ncbi:MAG: PH domain-containing protein [Microthrixaceae bacterium]
MSARGEPWDGVVPVRRPRRPRGAAGAGSRGRRRPGAGQSAHRASRGWHPDTIVAAYLVPGERVVLEETRSVRGFLLNQVVWIVLAVVGLAVVATLGQAAVTALGVVALGVFAAYLAVQALKAWFTRYVVTDLRVLRVSGVLNRNAEFIPWGKVTDITRSESLLQWWAHTATIRIESANERSGFRAIDDVDDPGHFYRVLVEMVDRKQGRLGDVTIAER